MTGAARLRLGPGAAQAFAILFAVSTAFPVIAGLLPASGVSSTLGILDVAVAAMVVLLGLAIESAARDRVSDGDRLMAWRVVRVMAAVPLLLLVVFFVRPDLVRWDVLLAGLALRAWLLWVLPAVVSLMRRSD